MAVLMGIGLCGIKDEGKSRTCHDRLRHPVKLVYLRPGSCRVCRRTGSFAVPETVPNRQKNYFEFRKETNMKKRKTFGMILAACAITLLLAGCSFAFEGSSVKDADSYRLDVKNMTGTDTHTLELQYGDTLHVRFETVKGSLDMKITAPDGTALYQGDGTVKEFAVEVPMDGAYFIAVVGQRAKGSIRVDAVRITEAVVPQEPKEPQEPQEPDAIVLHAEDLVGPWHLTKDEKGNAAAIAELPGAMEFGSRMEIGRSGDMSWYIGADGGNGTYSLNNNVLSSSLTNILDGSPMKMEFTAKKSGSAVYLYTEYKSFLLCWSQGEDEMGKGREDTGEVDFSGLEAVELVNLRGDTTTVYKLADGTYMDRMQQRFTYNGKDAWFDEDGVEWNETVE